ncbi:P-loop NTPase fold protein, partial [Actinocorallia lasiicapitis]
MINVPGAAEDIPWVDAQPGGVGVIVSWRNAAGAVRLATAGTDRTVRIWDPIAGRSVGEPLVGHEAVVGILTCWQGPDGRHLVASAGEDHGIRIWDPETGEAELPPLTGHTEWVMGLTSWTGPDGPRIASASIDRTVRIWDALTGAPVGQPLEGHTEGLWAVVCCTMPDGSVRLVSGGDDGMLRFWSAETGEPLLDPVEAHVPSGLLGLHTWTDVDGAVLVASGGVDGSVKIWDATTGAQLGSTLSGHRATVRSLTTWIDRDGRPRLASAAADGTVRLWDTDSFSQTGPARTGHSGWMPAITTFEGPAGEVWLASAGDQGTIRLWDPETGDDVATPLVGHVAGMWALTSWVLPDGKARVASGGDEAVIRVWDPETGLPIGSPLVGHTAGIWALEAWITDEGGACLASAGDDGTLRLWDTESGTALGEPLDIGSAWTPALAHWRTPDGGHRLASGSIDGKVRVWDPESREPLAVYTATESSWVLALTSRTDEEGRLTLAIGLSDGTVQIWDPAADTVLATLTGHTDWARSLTSWQGPRPGLASSSFDHTVRVWWPEPTGFEAVELAGHSARVGCVTGWLDAEGRPFLASGSDDDSIRVWSAEEGRPLGEPLLGHTSGIWAITSWSTEQTGPRLASAGYDGTVRLWDPMAGVAIRTIEVGPVAMWGLSDAPAGQDTLGRSSLAEAIADQIYRPLNADPLDDPGAAVVSVEGPWGSGKSTLMGMVRDRLPAELRPEPVTAPNRRLTVRRAMLMIKRHGRTERTVRPATPNRGVITAWFNPWTHQSGEQVWAGLVNEIIGAARAVLYPSDGAREHYWFERNLDRVDRYSIRRALLRRIVSPLLGVGLGATVLPIILGVGELNHSVEAFGHSWSATALALIGAALFLLAGLAHTAWLYLFRSAAPFLPGELFHIPVLDRVSVTDVRGNTETFSDPLRRAQAGSLYLLQHNVGDILGDLRARGYDLVVFVDDLDRCRAGTVAEVFEAINLFLSSISSGSDFKARFVVGFDPTVIAAHLDSHFELNGAAQALSGEDMTPGWSFLRKLVQLPVVVPQIDDAGIRSFVDTVTGSPRAAVAPVRVPAPRAGSGSAPDRPAG